MRIDLALLLTLAITLSGCGGGSGNTGSAAPSPAAPTIDPAPALPTVDISSVTLADPGSTLAEGWQSGAFMEIYVRGYQDSDGDGIGDLKGLTSRLDYLRDLGIKGVWLMPVTRSQDHDHGYAVSDYRNIETAYGSLADFDEFVRQAHARGIGVIIDYVINHSATQHPLFVNSAASSSNPYRDWYLWQSQMPAGWSIYGMNPWRLWSLSYYFAAFDGSMPDFNFRNPAVLSWHQDNLRFWLNRGVDGFRFDAVPNLVENSASAWYDQPESYLLMGQLHNVVSSYRQRYMVCEAAANPTAWAAQGVCGSAFAFGHQSDIVNAARGQTAAIAALATYFGSAPASMATLISNHDAFAGQRLWDQLGGDTARYRLAAATYLLQPGTPFIYYGEEIGMAGAAGLQADASLRTPMSWSADARGFTSGQPFRALSANIGQNNVAGQLADANSLHAFYKSMLGLRNALPSIARGSFEAAKVQGGALTWQRRLGTERTLVVLNYDTAAGSVQLDGLGAAARLVPAWPAGAVTLNANATGSATLTLAPQSLQVFVIQP